MHTLTFLLLAVFCLFIGICGFVRWDASWLRDMNTVPVQILIILTGIIFLCAALFLIFRLLKRLDDRGLKRAALLCILILAAGQLLLLLLFRPMLRYDPLKTFDMAVEMLKTHAVSETYEGGYFARYTNNYPIVLLTYWFLSVLSKFGLPQSSFMPAVQLVNVICITGSAWLGYLIVKELKGRRKAVFYLTVCVLCPLSYVWAGFFYTTTCSIPCLMGILYLYLRMPKAGTAPKRTLLGGLMGLLLILGYKLRATTMIAGIAVFIMVVIRLWKLTAGKRKSLPQLTAVFSAAFKKYVSSIAVFLVTAVLSLAFWHAATERYVPFDYENTGFPMIHWVMMSSRWDGSFDQSDELYTFSFKTKEEKIEADKKVLLERIRDAGPAGLAVLAGRKLLNTWADGTDSFLAENSYCTYGRLYEYLLGSKSGFTVIYSQIFRVLQMLIIGLSALRALKRRTHSPLFLIQLTFLGGIAFHLVWETNPLYSICFTFLGLILLSDGIASLAEEKALSLVLPKSRFVCTGALAVVLVLLILCKGELVETPIEEQHYRVNQYQYAGEAAGFVSGYEQIYTQTFTADKPFNRIAVQAINTVGPYNQSAFMVKLTDEHGTVLYDEKFLSGMVVKNTPYAFVLDPVVPDGLTRYTLEIAPGYVKGEDSLEFLAYNTGNCDMYPGGSLSIGGDEQTNGDLAFSVYEYEVTTYFNLKVYLILCGGILILLGGITAGMWFLFRKKNIKSF